jgi:NAD(P)H-hydrate epimerase
MIDQINALELAELLQETGRRHHAAYESSNGVDPEWASWYAPYLLARLGERLGTLPTRSELTYLLVAAEKAYQHKGNEAESWAEFYAVFILDNYSADEVD